uniref:Uncharacterized protein n=1 Tax=Myoviridae sp. ctino4 TaxID=2826686 RepID=A0A8S5MUN6_9CAUD|nr:MAG TPA: hypothetical protein [Myoviridae sp. ctino4]
MEKKSRGKRKKAQVLHHLSQDQPAPGVNQFT